MGDVASQLLSGEGIVFVLLSVGIVAMAIMCMTRRNPVTAVMSLVATFFGLAALYATLSAHFIAVIQILVYAGAIMVLFIFVVMIINREETTLVSLRGLVVRGVGVAATLYLFKVFVVVALPGPVAPPVNIPDRVGTVAASGDVLCRQFVFPFEAISLLLLVAIVGGVVVSRSHRKEVDAIEAAERRLAVARLCRHDYPGEAADGDGDSDGHGHGAHAAEGGH